MGFLQVLWLHPTVQGHEVHVCRKPRFSTGDRHKSACSMGQKYSPSSLLERSWHQMEEMEPAVSSSSWLQTNALPPSSYSQACQSLNVFFSVTGVWSRTVWHATSSRWGWMVSAASSHHCSVPSRSSFPSLFSMVTLMAPMWPWSLLWRRTWRGLRTSPQRWV